MNFTPSNVPPVFRPATRREFLRRAAQAAALLATARGVAAAAAPSWTIGCLNRPWTKWSADEMLDGVKAAGFRHVGLQTPTAADPFVAPNATPDYLAQLKRKIAARGLEATMGRLRLVDGAADAAAFADIRRQVANARTLGLGTLINTGTGKAEHHAAWFRAMAYAAAHGAEHGVKIVTKPHGGVTAAAAELRACVEKINHPNFGVWYDAGNVIHYTGKDPLAELEPIIAHVTAFTAKDCATKGGEVMLQFGRGAVDFAAIFRRLRRAGFAGPIMIESCAIGATASETTANARANREFLERTLAAL